MELTRYRLRAYVTASICACGETVLRDEIPLGRIYETDERSISHGTYTCGGCDTSMIIDTIRVKDDSGKYRTLPLGIFGPPQEVQ